MKINIEKYNKLILKDCIVDTTIYEIILLNKKHSIDEFQQNIYEIKNKIEDYTIEEVLQDEKLKKYDFIELNFDEFLEV